MRVQPPYLKQGSFQRVCSVTALLLETSLDLVCFLSSSVTMVTVLDLASSNQYVAVNNLALMVFMMLNSTMVSIECGVHTNGQVIVWGLVTQEGSTARLGCMM